MYNPNLHFHFTGIGGSGMSGIAEILLSLGFRVSGSDLRISAACERLMALGARIVQGHASAHVPPECSLLVYSSAVSLDNQEVLEAHRRGIPVVRRAEVLAELMRLKFGVAVAGSHGKTTTTSMTASILERGGLDPTVIIGGQVKSTSSGGKLGKSHYLVAESDESDRSFLLLRPTIAVITNIDREHLAAYDSFEQLVSSFEQFARAVPFYGLAVFCIDDPFVRRLSEEHSGRKIRYGFSEDADLRAVNVESVGGASSYDLLRDGKTLVRVRLAMPGRHLVQNSLAAIAVGLEFGVSLEHICEALERFPGVKRRLEVLGQPSGVTIINDYGHHPTEIRATVEAVRSGWASNGTKLHVLFQPHRYTRTRDCFQGFTDAFHQCDRLYVADIYAAGETPLAGISARKLCDAIVSPQAEYLPDLSQAAPYLKDRIRPGDVLLCLGAGSIGGVAERLVDELR